MKLLITGAWQDAKKYIKDIESLGHEVVFMQNEKDDLPCNAEEVEGTICNGLFLYHDIEKFSSLKFIQLTSAGFDRVPMDYVKSHDIEIFNARGVYSVPMAEFCLSGVLSLYKKFKTFVKNQSECKWEKDRTLLELYGKRVLIVGCGSVGTECAKRFSAFGCNVYGIDLKPYKSETYNEMFSLNELDNQLGLSDVVVLTLPLTEDTKGLFNKERFSKMKDGSVIVNIARGGIIDTDALICALSEKLYGAVLDVFEEEPLSLENPLWKTENVVLTPHNSFVGEGNGNRLKDVIFRGLQTWRLKRF